MKCPGLCRQLIEARRLALLALAELVFFGDALEIFGHALDSIRQSVVVLDRQRPHDLVLPARRRIAERLYCGPVLRHPAGLIQAANFTAAVAF